MADAAGVNSGILAALLFVYIFIIQHVPMAQSTRLAAQPFVGVAGVLLGFYLARLTVYSAAALYPRAGVLRCPRGDRSRPWLPLFRVLRPPGLGRLRHDVANETLAGGC
jgi:hypothetical protein